MFCTEYSANFNTFDFFQDQPGNLETWGLLNQEQLTYELFPVITRELLTGSRAEMLFTQYSDVDKMLECGPKLVEVNNPSQFDDIAYGPATEDNFTMFTGEQVCDEYPSYSQACDEYPGFVKVRDHRNRLLLPKVWFYLYVHP